MFKKKSCKKCGEKVTEKFLFCPNCGNLLNKKGKKKDFGMLGEDDFIDEFESIQNSLFKGAGGKMVGKMFEGIMKIVEKEMEKEANKRNTKNSQKPKTNFQLFINGEKIDNFKTNFPANQKIKEQEKEVPALILPQNNLKKFSDLPKNEPKTDVRRFSDRVIYEINIPGVKSLKDISIIRLENNIEVKAVTKNKAYNKLIPVNFPISDYNFTKGKLVLELDSKD